MRPAVLMPITVFTALCAGGAWLEYSQHSGLMLHTARADVAQLCADLKNAGECPTSQRLRTREAKDPWSHRYQCRAKVNGLLIYTLGADGEVGGTRRDADIVGVSGDGREDEAEAEPCACLIGDEASKLLE